MEMDEEFKKELLETFKVEAREHIQSLTELLLGFEKDFHNLGTKENIEHAFRDAHSLKGAARSVGLSDVQDLCQQFEDLLAALKKGALVPSKAFFETAFSALDQVSKVVQNPEDHEVATLYQQMADRIQELNKLQPQESGPSSEETQIDLPPKRVVSSEQRQSNPPPKASRAATIRVPIQRLDRMITQIEELWSVKIFYKQLSQGITQIEQLVRTKEKQVKLLTMLQQCLRHRIPVTENYYEYANDLFSELQAAVLQNNTATSELVKKLIHSSNRDSYLIDSLVKTLTEDTKQLLMQPFITMLDVFPRMIRDIALQLGKKVDFQVEGELTEIDKRILEELKDPLIHLVRNSIDHGIEMPEEREKLNKPVTGTIRIAVSQVGGNQIQVVVSDDGRGFSIEKIRAKALQQKLITQKEANELSKEELLALTMHSSLSTADIITELSGRGVGLGVLVEKLEKLGGNCSLETNEGQGTTFFLNLPLTRATFRGLCVLAGDREFIVPTNNLIRLLRKGSFEMTEVEDRNIVIENKKSYPYIALHEALGVSGKVVAEPSIVLLLSTGRFEIAVGIEKVISEQEVVVKSLGANLQKITSISAATILEAGKVVPILDVGYLVKKCHKSLGIRMVEEVKEEFIGKILVAEDTQTTRLLFKNILMNSGYTVLTAVDGQEAWEIMQQEKVDLLITDIEMPRMRGFELLEKVRNETTLKELPVIIITAMESKEDKQRGVELGADAYIEKSSFVQDELLSIIKSLL